MKRYLSMQQFIVKIEQEERTISYGKSREDREEYRRRIDALTQRFKAELFSELGIEHNPKRELLFDLAWRDGHSSGYHQVYNFALDLVDLIRPDAA